MSATPAQPAPAQPPPAPAPAPSSIVPIPIAQSAHPVSTASVLPPASDISIPVQPTSSSSPVPPSLPLPSSSLDASVEHQRSAPAPAPASEPVPLDAAVPPTSAPDPAPSSSQSTAAQPPHPPPPPPPPPASGVELIPIDAHAVPVHVTSDGNGYTEEIVIDDATIDDAAIDVDAIIEPKSPESPPRTLRRSRRVRRPTQLNSYVPYSDIRSTNDNDGGGGGGGSTTNGASSSSSRGTGARGRPRSEELNQVQVMECGSLRMTVHPCAAALMQLHAHLARTEVIGYMGGFTSGHCVHVAEAFPATCVASSVLARSGRSAYREVEMEPESDVEVRARIALKGLSVVGWYHSHPDPAFSVDPSHVDIENQENYQRYIFRNEPFVATILAPYNEDLPDCAGAMSTFYVHSSSGGTTADSAGENGNAHGPDGMKSAHTTDENRNDDADEEYDSTPLQVPFEIAYEAALPAAVDCATYKAHLGADGMPLDALEAEASNLISFYSRFRQRAKLADEWREGVSILEKLDACLQGLLPQPPVCTGDAVQDSDAEALASRNARLCALLAEITRMAGDAWDNSRNGHGKTTQQNSRKRKKRRW